VNFRRILFLTFLSTTLAVPSLSQDLGGELDALDDFPEAENSESGGSASDDLPDDESVDDLGGDDAPADDAGADDLGDDLGDVEGDTPKENPDDDLGGLDDDAVPSGGDEELPDDDLSLGDDSKDSNNLSDDLGALDEPKKNAKVQDSTTGTDLGPVSRVKSIQFRQLNDRVRAVIGGEGALEFSKQVRSQRKQVIIEIRNAILSKSVLKRAMDTGEFDGPVALIQAYDSKAGSIPTVKVLFQLRQMQEFKILRSGNDLYVDFSIGGSGGLFRSGSAGQMPTLPETFLTLDTKMKFTGEKISLNVKDAELQGILNQLKVQTGKNFILTGAATTGRVSLNIKNTPWDQVLAIILANLQLGYQKMGDVYRIAPVATLKDEINNAAKTVEDSEKLIPVETRLIPVNYARANDIQTNVKDFMSTRGKISIDARTNSLVITDIPANLEKIMTYVRSVDKQTALIQIEARVVEARADFSRELNQAFNLGPVASGTLQNSTLSIGNQATAGNLRVSTSLGSMGTIDAFLGWTESESMSKTIASPRVLVLDNKDAIIENGLTIPAETITQANGSTSSTPGVTQKLNLTVKPQVTSDGFVYLTVDIVRDSAVDSGSTTTINRKAKTEMIVESGKTAMIGGIYTVTKNELESGFPMLRALPIFGTLFRESKTLTNNTEELLFFISPKIVNANRAFLSYKDDLKEEGESGSSTQAKAPSGSDAGAGDSDEFGDEGEDIGDFDDL